MALLTNRLLTEHQLQYGTELWCDLLVFSPLMMKPLALPSFNKTVDEEAT